MYWFVTGRDDTLYIETGREVLDKVDSMGNYDEVSMPESWKEFIKAL